LQRAPRAAHSLRAQALHWLGVLEWCLGSLQDSRRDHEEAMALCRSIGDELLLGEGLYRVGLTALFQDDLSGLERFAEELAAVGDGLGSPRLRALAGSNRAAVESERNNVAQAIRYADESLELMRQVGDAYAYGFFQNVLGELTRLGGDYARAKVAYEAELRIAEQLGCKRFLTVGNANLAQVAAAEGDWTTALHRTKTALQINHALGERRNMPLQLLTAAEVVMHLRAPDLAGRLIGAAEASLATLPIHYWAADQKSLERLRQTTAERLSPDRLARLRREGATLTLEEAILGVLSFSPSVS